MWDGDKDMCLFTTKALEDAGKLIELVTEQDVVMLLPKGIPTLKHMVTKRHSRPDNFFCTNNITNHVTKCNTMPERQLGKTDHYLIATILELVQERMLPKTSQNIRETDWEEFNVFLGKELTEIPVPDEM
jgi:hypothetical protein